MSAIAAMPPATKGLIGALLGFTLLLAGLRLTMTEEKLHVIHWSKNDSALHFPWLVIVPGQSYMYPWTLLTSAFCETSFIEFCISAISLPLFGRYLEPIWGSVELLKFSAVVLIGSNIIAWALAILQFAVFRKDSIIFGTQYHGLTALQAGFLVALTQMIPEHQVQVFGGRFKMQVKTIPMTYVTISTVLCLLGYLSPWILIQFGWLISWAWLRFFKMSESGFRGDRSETFSFVNWFPPFAHRPVTILSNFLFMIFTRLHIVRPWQYSPNDIEAGPGLSRAPTGPSRAEAERRRAMALKALDQRMATGGGRAGTVSRQSSLKGAAGPSRAAGGVGSAAAASGTTQNGDAGPADATRTAADAKHIDDAKEGDNLLRGEGDEDDAEDDGDIGASGR